MNVQAHVHQLKQWIYLQVRLVIKRLHLEPLLMKMDRPLQSLFHYWWCFCSRFPSKSLNSAVSCFEKDNSVSSFKVHSQRTGKKISRKKRKYPHTRPRIKPQQHSGQITICTLLLLEQPELWEEESIAKCSYLIFDILPFNVSTRPLIWCAQNNFGRTALKIKFQNNRPRDQTCLATRQRIWVDLWFTNKPMVTLVFFISHFSLPPLPPFFT